MTDDPRHAYIGDQIPDHRGEDRCIQCQRPRRHPSHVLPDVPEQRTHHERYEATE